MGLLYCFLSVSTAGLNIYYTQLLRGIDKLGLMECIDLLLHVTVTVIVDFRLH